jgi:D-xylose transport system permease protein
MTDTPHPSARKAAQFFAALEIDTRLLGMIGAFVMLCLVFNFLTDGRFLTPRNIFNLTIQTVSVAIMATGMVFVIVTRHIDLSVGSLLATCSAMMAMTQTVVVPDGSASGSTIPATRPWRSLSAWLTGTLIGAFQGWLIGYLTIPPSSSRWAASRLAQRRLVPDQRPDDRPARRDLSSCSAASTARWARPGAGSSAVCAAARSTRCGVAPRTRSPRVPGQADLGRADLGAIIAVAILGFVAILNAYEIPVRRLERMFEARGEVMPEGFTAGYGIPISVLLLIVWPSS